MLKRLRTEWLAIIYFFVYSYLIWLPGRYNPFHWDGAGFLATAIKHILDSNFTQIIAIGSDFAHPPLIVYYFAIIYKLFHGSFLALHVGNYFFLPVLLISTYYLAKKILPHFIALLVTHFLSILPIVLSEYSQIYLDLPTAAFTTLSVCLFLYKKPIVSMFIFTLAVLSKETSLLFLPMFGFWFFSNYPQKTNKKLLLIPVASILLYWFYHQYQVGWLLIDPTITVSHRFVTNLPDIFQSTKFYVYHFALKHNLWLITLPGFIALFLVKSSNKIIQGFFISLIVVSLFFILGAEFTPRYALLIYPLLLILSINYCYQFLKNNYLDHLVIIIIYQIFVSIFLISSWYPSNSLSTSYDFQPPSDLSTQDMIYINRMLGVHLSQLEPSSQIFGGFPENIYLSDPFQGYVNQPLNFTLCQQFKLDKTQRQLVVIHPYSPAQVACKMTLDQYPNQAISRYESGSRWVELYYINPN